MMKKLLTLLLGVIFIIPLVMGDTITKCIDFSTMQVTVVKTLTIDGNVTNISVVDDVNCPYGCDNNQCQNASLVTETNFAIIFLVSAFLIGLGAYTDNKLFALIGGILLLIMGVYILSEGIVVNSILYKNIAIRVVGLIFVMLGIYLLYSFALDIKGGEEDV